MWSPNLVLGFVIFFTTYNGVQETLAGETSLFRLKRGIEEGNPEYKYFEAAFAAVDEDQGLTGKQNSYVNQFTQFFQDTRARLGNKYKGELDWNQFSAWRYKNYGAAAKALNKKVEEAYKNPTSRSKAVTAMKLIEGLVKERKRLMDKHPDANHIKVYNKWRDQWADWYNKYGSEGFLYDPPPRKSM